MPISRRMDKEDGVLCTVECSSAIKRDKLELFLGKWVYFETIILSEINQTYMLKYISKGK